MSSSPSSQSAHGQAEASSSRISSQQPHVEEAYSDDEEGLMAADPLDDAFPEQYARNYLTVLLLTNVEFPSSGSRRRLLLQRSRSLDFSRRPSEYPVTANRQCHGHHNHGYSSFVRTLKRMIQPILS
jgi:hypothetical protein